VPLLARLSPKSRFERLIYLPVGALGSGVGVVDGVGVVEVLGVEVVLVPVAAGLPLSQPVVNAAKLQSTSNVQIFFIDTPFLKTGGEFCFAGPPCTLSLPKEVAGGKFIPTPGELFI
jgi:hypothetical protein